MGVLTYYQYSNVKTQAKGTESQNGSVVEESDESRDQNDLWKSLKDFAGGGISISDVMLDEYKVTNMDQWINFLCFCNEAIMKSFAVKGSDNVKQDKFLAYMVPSPDELSKDMYDEHEDISFTWVREYHWDVRGEDADDPTTYLVAFDESEARYVPLPTKLVLRKKRAREGKSSDEVEHFPAPVRVTVRRRSQVSAVELKETGGYSGVKASASASKRQRGDDGSPSQHRKAMHDADIDQSSGAEYDMSD